MGLDIGYSLMYNAAPMRQIQIFTFAFALCFSPLFADQVTKLRPVISEVATANGLDPVMLEAIIRHESAHATSKAARRKNNLAGIMGRRSLRSYKSKEDSVRDLGRVLGRYKARGRVTVDQIGPIYCQSSSPWERYIKQHMREIKRGKHGVLESSTQSREA